MSLYGIMPPNNAYAGNYTFICAVRDPYDAPPNNYTFYTIVNPN
jgi:hypothetical protein